MGIMEAWHAYHSVNSPCVLPVFPFLPPFLLCWYLIIKVRLGRLSFSQEHHDRQRTVRTCPPELRQELIPGVPCFQTEWKKKIRNNKQAWYGSNNVLA